MSATSFLCPYTEGLNEEEVFRVGGSRRDSGLRFVVRRGTPGTVPVFFNERAPDVHIWVSYPLLLSV